MASEGLKGPKAIPLKCRELIRDAFVPLVTVTVSEDTDELCQQLGFDKFVDLLAPFGDKISGRVTVRNSQAISSAFDDFSIRFASPYNNETSSSAAVAAASSEIRPPASPLLRSPQTSSSSTFLGSPRSSPSPFPSSTPILGHYPTFKPLFDKSFLEECIAVDLNNPSSSSASSSLESSTSSISSADHQLKYNNKAYLGFFKNLILSPPVTSFETFSHPVTGIIAISSRNPQPIETLSILYRKSLEPTIPEHINRDYLRYYVLVHDEQTGDLQKSIALFEKMKRNFGLHCHMIRVNHEITDKEHTQQIRASHWHPRDNNSAEKSQLKIIHEEDFESIRILTRELVVQSVVPFMERCVSTWNDQIASGRRGLTGRFFSASKKYFASSSRATSSILSGAGGLGQGSSFPFSLSGSNSSPPAHTPSSSGNYNPATSSYGYLTPEAQLRKLADFAFMLRDYKFAYNTYELLKRDFHNDKAWAYLAASQEMAAISFLMSLENVSLSTKTRLEILEPLLDSATYSYISRCSLPSYALRCILLASELLCCVRSHTAASEGATKWILKALNEKLVGRLGYAMLMERVSGAYQIYDVRQSSNSLNSANSSTSSLATSLADVSLSDPSPGVKSAEMNSLKIQRPTGTKRTRKAAFWMLIAAREWLDAKRMDQVNFCIDQTQDVYGDLEWTKLPSGLLTRLTNAQVLHNAP